MTHPHSLHAIASLWSLQAAWPALSRAVVASRRADADNADRGTLRAWAPGSVVSGGSGPARSAVLDAVMRPTVDHPVLRVYDQATGAVWWLVRDLGLSTLHDTIPATLRQLVGVVPRLPPPVAGRLARHVADEDRKVRAALSLGDDYLALTGAECPSCSTWDLAWRTSAPRDRWVVTCRAGCVCVGEGCRCGMGVREAGVAHIWTGDQMAGAT